MIATHHISFQRRLTNPHRKLDTNSIAHPRSCVLHSLRSSASSLFVSLPLPLLRTPGHLLLNPRPRLHKVNQPRQQHQTESLPLPEPRKVIRLADRTAQARDRRLLPVQLSRSRRSIPPCLRPFPYVWLRRLPLRKRDHKMLILHISTHSSSLGLKMQPYLTLRRPMYAGQRQSSINLFVADVLRPFPYRSRQ